jgi:hypothetical protein
LSSNYSGDPFADRESINKLIFIPQARALWVCVTTPQVNNSTTSNSDANRGAYLGVLIEIIEKGFANWLKGRVDVTVRGSATAQSADFSRMCTPHAEPKPMT